MVCRRSLTHATHSVAVIEFGSDFITPHEFVNFLGVLL